VRVSCCSLGEDSSAARSLRTDYRSPLRTPGANKNQRRPVSQKICLTASQTDTTAGQHLGCQQNTTTEHCSRRHLTPTCQSDWATSIPHGKLRLKQNQRPKPPHSAIATPEPAAPAWLSVSHRVLVDRSAPQGILEPPSKEWVSACLFYTNRLITLQDEPITRRGRSHWITAHDT
jgi:hypothetical protein